MPRDSSLRASDSDREAVTERLRRAAGEGRLEPEELEDRLHAALRARTYGDLDQVTGDLPASPAVWERPGAALMPAARTALAVTTQALVMLVVVTLLLVDAALTVAWWLAWALMRGHGYAAGRLGARPGRPAGLL